jgi:type II secretory pathway pseudopilin PulG
MKSRAFSLIELILAIGIFAFASISIFTLVNRGLQTSREARLESAAAILAGKITSLLKASYAWTTNSSANPLMTNYIGSQTLADIAAGSPCIRTNLYNIGLSNVPATDPNAEFCVLTEISPLNQSIGQVVPAEPPLQQALSRIQANAKNCVLVRIEVSSPARMPENLRSKRHFASIVTMSTHDD